MLARPPLNVLNVAMLKELCDAVDALAGRPRGTDEEMCALLEPYRPQRGRVTRLLLLDGHREPRFGPKRRLLPMHRW